MVDHLDNQYMCEDRSAVAQLVESFLVNAVFVIVQMEMCNKQQDSMEQDDCWQRDIW